MGDWFVPSFDGIEAGNDMYPIRYLAGRVPPCCLSPSVPPASSSDSEKITTTDLVIRSFLF